MVTYKDKTFWGRTPHGKVLHRCRHPYQDDYWYAECGLSHLTTGGTIAVVEELDPPGYPFCKECVKSLVHSTRHHESVARVLSERLAQTKKWGGDDE